MKNLAIIVTAGFLFSLLVGCTKLIMPYAEEPMCRKGIVGGYCGSITEVYDVTTEEMKRKKIADKKTSCPSGNCNEAQANNSTNTKK